MKYTPFKHQQDGADFWLKNDCMLNFSDAGSGKTLTSLLAIRKRQSEGRILILAPLSILQPAWGDDIEKFTPELSYSVAYARTRAKAFEADTKAVITNHDAVNWLLKNESVLNDFDTLIIDESTVFKNKTSGRSKAIIKLSEKFKYRLLLSGTPNPNTILDVFSQALICDGGERLGKNYFHFRNQVCAPKQNGPDPRHVEWRDKPGAADIVSGMLADITFRVRLEDCIDMPETSTHTVYTELPKTLRKQYDELLSESLLMMKQGTITAVHAGARMQKLLQLITGTVYDADGNKVHVHTGRHELVLELIKEREQCLVAFNWRHERESMAALFEKEGISFGVIDGTVSVARRKVIVDDLQAGKLKVVLAHPKSAGHGLTLTKGTTTIWASPVYSSESYEQFNHRIYRNGQTKKTETIRICAKNTAEVQVLKKLDKKCESLHNVLDLFKELTGFSKNEPCEA